MPHTDRSIHLVHSHLIQLHGSILSHRVRDISIAYQEIRGKTPITKQLTNRVAGAAAGAACWVVAGRTGAAAARMETPLATLARSRS